jgi:probable phosphoglycerate mutase
MHLYLIRHGQSYINLKEWQDGNQDTSLTGLGHEQAARLAAYLPAQIPHVDVLYSSSMRRALETAETLAAAYQLPLVTDDRLREIGNNRRDHSPYPSDGLPREYASYWASERPYSPITVPPDGGESYMHFRTRVGNFIEEMLETHQDQVVVAVCHGGVIEAVFNHVFNVGPWQRCEVWTHNTGLTYFEYVNHPNREAWRLHWQNRIDHLNFQQP